ncbi:MAG TPA: transcriptional regulator, partial [Microbacterium sp.]|nr:transcriptional regulator [Microbacterium sp.]
MVVRNELSDEQIDRVFQALAARTRRDILRRTIDREQSVSELARD